MNKTVGNELEFSGNASFTVVDSAETSLTGEIELSWGALSALVDGYLKANRGRKLSPEHYRNVINQEIERIILEKTKNAEKEVLEVKIDLPKEFGIQSKNVKGKVSIDWFPTLPEINLDDIEIKQYKLENFTKEEIAEVKDQFLDSNRIPIDWDGPIEKGDIVRILWKWKMDDESEWSEDETDDSSSVIKVGVNPRLEPGLESKLIGNKKGGYVEHAIKVPSNLNEGSVNPQFAKYIKQIVRFAGKSIQLRMEVLDVQRPEKPSLDEGLLKKFDLESEEALEAKITKNLQNYMTTQNLEAAFAQILDYLRKSKVGVPEKYASEYTKYMLSKFANLLHVKADEEGYKLDSEEFQNDLMNAVKLEFPEWKYDTFEDFKDKVAQVSKEIVSGDFMLNQVTKLANLSEDELQQGTLQAWMSLDNNSRKNMNESQIREFFKNMRNRVILTKFLDILKSNDRVKEVETTSLKEFEKYVTSNSDDALHTKYFGVVNN